MYHISTETDTPFIKMKILVEITMVLYYLSWLVNNIKMHIDAYGFLS